MRLTTLLPVVALLVLVYSQQYPVFPQTKTPTVKPLASISGKVSFKGKGLPGIAVGVRRMEAFTPFQTLSRAVTGADGIYRIQDLEPGNYQVLLAAGAYVVDDVIYSRNRSVIVSDGENVEGVNFSMVRGGVITGRITDDVGRPVIQQQVQIYKADAFTPRPNQPQQQVSVSNLIMTDDRGIYRFFGVPAGRYKVASGEAENVSWSDNRTNYRQVFFPNTSDPAEATIIEVSEGSEATDVNISLSGPMQTFSASGRVVNTDANNSGVAGIRLGVQYQSGKNSYGMVNRNITTNSQGDFTIDSLSPGSYSLFFMPDPNNEMKVSSQSFDVTDQNVEGIVLQLSKGATVSGVVQLQTNDEKAFGQLISGRLYGYVMSQNRSNFPDRPASTAIGPDGSFRMGGLPAGILRLQLGGTMGFDPRSKGFGILRIERDGAVLSNGVEIKEAEQVSNIRVIVSYGSAALRGVVNIENGTLPPENSIYIRVSKPGEIDPNGRSTGTDARGRFLIEGLAAGTYEVSCSIIGPLPLNAKPRPPVTQQVTLRNGTTADVVLTIDLGASQ